MAANFGRPYFMAAGNISACDVLTAEALLSCLVPQDGHTVECVEHQLLLGAVLDELTVLLDFVRRESAVRRIGAENTLRLVRARKSTVTSKRRNSTRLRS